MAKKFGKFLLGTAAIGAAVAGGIAYINKYKKDMEKLDDDFEDFEDEFDDDDLYFDDDDKEETDEQTREYVPLHRQEEPAEETPNKPFEPLDD